MISALIQSEDQTAIVMKTGAHPFISKLKLFFKWGISFPESSYTIADKGARHVHYHFRSKHTFTYNIQHIPLRSIIMSLIINRANTIPTMLLGRNLMECVCC